MTNPTRSGRRLAALATATAVVLTSCSTDPDGGDSDSGEASPAETTAAEAGPLDDFPEGVDVDDLDPELVEIYNDGEEMRVDEACELATELDLDTAQLLAVGVLLEDPSLGQQFLNLADARQRQEDPSVEPREFGEAFNDETDAGAAIDETC